MTEQELHNLAMNLVGRQLEADGYEFMGINSTLGKNPQYVCLREKVLHFIVVRPVAYPEDPTTFDRELMDQVREHAQKFNAKCFYAGVGLSNAEDRSRPVELDREYVVDYRGLIEI